MTVSLSPLLVFLLLCLPAVNTVTIPDPSAQGEQKNGDQDPREEIGNPGDEIIKRVNVTDATSDDLMDKLTGREAEEYLEREVKKYLERDEKESLEREGYQKPSTASQSNNITTDVTTNDQIEFLEDYCWFFLMLFLAGGSGTCCLCRKSEKGCFARCCGKCRHCSHPYRTLEVDNDTLS